VSVKPEAFSSGDRNSRIDSGKLDVAKRPCLLGPVIQEAAHDAEPLRTAPRVRLHRPERPVMVDADPALLKQVFLNLMENALLYSPEGSPVDVSWRSSADGRFAVADVWGRGPGVPPADRERVFDRFVRLSRAPGRPDVAGAGLGLYIARSILDAHGGDLRVEDGEGSGARFVLRLPLAGVEA
jgi:signal transduction histidine kinase